MDPRNIISAGEAVLGLELGSTRIKAVLIDKEFKPIAQGSHEWENQLVNGFWTYGIDDIWEGLKDCYASLRKDVLERYGVEIESLASIGISAMMHGYMAFDATGKLLVPFRTWRNTNTGDAAKVLSGLFDFNMPLRWSLSHLYQCILDKEPHVADIEYLTTLSGYIHWKLTGCKVLGTGDASGMMPIDAATGDFDDKRVVAFDKLVEPEGFGWKLRDILPQVIGAGKPAGKLTAEGALLLDPSGQLKPGVPLCPPEGDAGTGMVATNAVRPGTGNVSAGTSSFSMIVLEKDLKQPHEVIDIVTTPDGSPVAMTHCNNCTTDLNAWVNLLCEYQELLGMKVDKGEVYNKLFIHALEGDADCGGLLNYNYIAGEHVTGFSEGRPLFIRSAGSRFNLANFMLAQLYATVGVLKTGNEILFKEENVKVDRITAHGGLFKTPVVGQKILAAALGTPISVMETAGEGGPWGMALLAAFCAYNPEGLSLPDFLDRKVFAGNTGTEIVPTEKDIAGFNAWFEEYTACLPIERSAVQFKK